MLEVVAAMIQKGDQFLACQRPPHKARALQWEFVGGKIEPGETGPQALIRECREELGVTLRVHDVIMDTIHEYPDLTVCLSLYHAEITDGSPQKLEHHDLRWLLPAEVDQYTFCPADKDILNRIKEEYK